MKCSGGRVVVAATAVSFLVVLACCAGDAQAVFHPGEYEVDGNTVALWHLNEGTGTTVYDETDNNNDGVLIGTNPPSWTSGEFGAGLQLTCSLNQNPGDGGAILLPLGILNRGSSTVEMYLNWDYLSQGPIAGDTGFVGYLFSDGNNTFARGYIDDTNPYRFKCKVSFGVSTYGGWLETVTPYEYSLDADTWTHVAFVRQWDGVNTTISIYVNGELAASNSIAAGGIEGGGSTYIGSVTQGTCSWGGQIDEIRISDVARTEFGLQLPDACGDWGYMSGDVNHDCYVNLLDFAQMAEDWATWGGGLGGDVNYDGCVNDQDLAALSGDWLACTDPLDPDCVQAPQQQITFENDQYLCRLTFNGGPAGLRWDQITNKDLGENYLYGGDDMPVFLVAGEGFLVDSTDFIVTDIEVIGESPNLARRIHLSHAGQQLQAILEVQTDDTDKMIWSLSVKNTAAAARKIMPIFPYMGRIRIGSSLTDNYYFFPWRTGIVGNIDCDLKHQYGALAWMQVVSVFNKTSGGAIYTYPQDSTGGFKNMPFKKSYGPGPETVTHSEVTLHQEQPNTGDPSNPVDVLADVEEGIAYTYGYPMILIPAGGEYALPATMIRIYEGNWKEALSDYKQWAHTWYSHVNTPKWFMNCFNMLGAWPPYYYSETEQRYYRSELFHDPDPMHLEQYAQWWDYEERPDLPPGRGMEKYQIGDYYYNQARGGLTAFADEIAASQAKGVFMSVYINYHLCWEGTDTGLAYGPAWAAKELNGGYVTWGVERWAMCPYEPNAWADYIVNTCARVVRDTGVDCIYLDEMPLLYYCYNPDHVHYQQDGMGFSVDRMRQFITNARNAIRQENPNGALMTEHAGSDYFTQFFDGSWYQTFYPGGFPFAEQYYDDNSLVYFRFVFPEFKLAEWGESTDDQKRNFFNGTGICKLLTGYIIQTGQVLRENGDAFASLDPEPLVPTKVANVLANKFPIDTKTIYTVYNKSGSDLAGTAILQVPRRSGYHYVELYNDSGNITVNAVGGDDELTFDIDDRDVLCIGQLPQIIQTSQDGDTLTITLSQSSGDETLAAFWNYDNSAYGFEDADIIDMTGGQGQIQLRPVFGKLILKLYDGDGQTLLDEVVIGEKPPSAPGTIALWHMDEGSGDTAYDAAGGDNNLLLGAEYYWTGGCPNTPPGYALGTPYYTDTYCSSWIHPDDITDAVTVSACVRVANVDSDGSYVLTMSNKFMLRINSISAVSFLVLTPDSVWHEVSAQPLGAGVPITNGQWYHVAGVYDGSPDQNGNVNLYLYWDGDLIAVESFYAPAGQELMPGGTGEVYIGAVSGNPDRGTQNFMGTIDEVEISNVVVTQF